VGDNAPPDRFLRAHGLVILPGEIRPREGRAWLVGWQGTRGVLRQMLAPAVSAANLAEDVSWLHGVLARLAGLGFPSPRPLPCFDGRSWTVADGALWEVVSFLPGHAVCWATRRFLRGYADVADVSPDQVSAIPVYLRGRGLQMIAKRVRAGRDETGMLAQVQWLTVNSDAVADALAAALP
jgi:hypothetical protein